MSFLCILVRLYIYILLARVVLSFVFMAKPDWRPPDGIRPVLDLIYMLTDPPIELLRRVIPPLRAGAFALDLAFLVWFLVIQYVILPIVC